MLRMPEYYRESLRRSEVGPPFSVISSNDAMMTQMTEDSEKLTPECAGAEHSHHTARRDAASPLALERAARLFRAAGDASRLRLLDELMAGERCVTELAEVTGANLSTVSQQLRTLRSEELVSTRREGKHVYYKLADQHVVELIANVLAHATESR